MQRNDGHNESLFSTLRLKTSSGRITRRGHFAFRWSKRRLLSSKRFAAMFENGIEGGHPSTALNKLMRSAVAVKSRLVIDALDEQFGSLCLPLFQCLDW